jgi:hypothetical protein
LCVLGKKIVSKMNFWVKKPYVLEKSDDALSTLAGEASFDFSFFKKLLGWIKKRLKRAGSCVGPNKMGQDSWPSLSCLGALSLFLFLNYFKKH